MALRNVPTSLSKRQKEILEEFNQIESNKPDPVIKSFFEKAKKLTNKNLKKEIDKSSKHDVGSKAWRDYWSAVFKRMP